MKFIKPNFWQYKKANLISKLLLPFTIPVRINNILINNKKIKKNKNIKTICVGNIYVGGTGKTPLAIELYKILKSLKLKVSIIKKYYKNQKDEQLILKKKTKLILCNSRKDGVNEALKLNNEVVIFDDGLQDRNVDYDIKVVCFNSKMWVGNNNIIPSGPLREKISSLSKYDVVFLNGSKKVSSKLHQTIYKINPKIIIFNSCYKIKNLKHIKKKNNYLIFSGIGNPNSFKEILLKKKLNILKQIIFPDHYQYNDNDIKKIKLVAEKLNAKILTTEKDFVKLSSKNKKKIYPVEIELVIKNKKKLINLIKLKI